MQLAVLSQRPEFRCWIVEYLARTVFPMPGIEHWMLLDGVAICSSNSQIDAVIIDGMYPAIEIQAASNNIRNSLVRPRILLAFTAESSPITGDPLFFQFGGCNLACVFPPELGSTPKLPCPQRSGACDSAESQHQTDPEERSLTSLQLEILKMLAEGASVKETAARLNRTTKSIDCQKSRIMSKLGIHDRVHLARYAIRRGLVAP